MTTTEQSLIKVYPNSDNQIVLVYGSTDYEAFQQIELDSIVLESKDAIAIGRAIIKCAKGIKEK